MQNNDTFSMKPGVEINLKGIAYSVHKNFPERKSVQLIRVSDESISEMACDSLHKAYVEGKLLTEVNGARVEQQAELTTPVVLDDFTEDQRKKYLNKCSYVNAFIALREEGPTTVVKVDRLISRVAAQEGDKKPPGASSVRRWVDKVDGAGGDRHALLPPLQQRRPNKGYSPDIRKKVVDVLLERYCTSQRSDLKHVLDTYVNPELIKMKLPSLPDYGTVRRWLYESTSAYQRYSKRFSPSEARRKFRSATPTELPQRILEVVEFDFTPLDIWVLDEVRRVIMGRVQLGVMIDRFSRMPLGFSLTYGGESATAVIKCLKHAIMPKAYLQEKYPEISFDWPAHGMFKRLRLDNGSGNHSIALKEACAELGIELEYTPTKQPWLKGCVESFMGKVAKKMQTLPGATFSGYLKRCGYDPKKHAALTLNDLEEALHRWIIDEYSNTPHSGLRMTPREAWELGASDYTPPLPVSPKILDRIAGHCKTVSLTHSGIRMHTSLRYASVELNEIRKLKANEGKRILVEIRYYEDDLSYINVKNPVTNEFIPVYESDQRYSAKMTLPQHKEVMRHAKIKYKATPKIAQLIEIKQEMAALIEEFVAKSRPGGLPKIARSDLIKATVKMRQDEEMRAGSSRAAGDSDFEIVPVETTY